MHLENLNLFKMGGGGAHLFEASYLGVDTSSLETLKTYLYNLDLNMRKIAKNLPTQTMVETMCVQHNHGFHQLRRTSFSIIGHHHTRILMWHPQAHHPLDAHCHPVVVKSHQLS
jgi:hypothetical protein